MSSRTAAASLLPLLFVTVVGCVDRGEARTFREAVADSRSAEATPQTYALGTELNVDGAVPRSAAGETFTRGGIIYLSVDVASASSAQQVGVVWRGPGGGELHRETRHVPRSARYVAFASGPTATWPRGACKAAVLIDGRVVAELDLALI